jgi:GTPase SAR1 family protein
MTGESSNPSQQYSRHQKNEPGEALFPVESLPPDLTKLIQEKVGEKTEIHAARENGKYKGVVFYNGTRSDDYLILLVGEKKTATVHRKEDLELKNQNLEWRDKNQRLNSTPVSIYYIADKGFVYPWNREKEQKQIARFTQMKVARAYAENRFPDQNKRAEFLKDVEIVFEQTWAKSHPVKSGEKTPEKTTEVAKEQKAAKPSKRQSTGKDASEGFER